MGTESIGDWHESMDVKSIRDFYDTKGRHEQGKQWLFGIEWDLIDVVLHSVLLHFFINGGINCNAFGTGVSAITTLGFSRSSS